MERTILDVVRCMVEDVFRDFSPGREGVDGSKGARELEGAERIEGAV